MAPYSSHLPLSYHYGQDLPIVFPFNLKEVLLFPLQISSKNSQYFSFPKFPARVSDLVEEFVWKVKKKPKVDEILWERVINKGNIVVDKSKSGGVALCIIIITIIRSDRSGEDLLLPFFYKERL